jgi:hypothetical protein
MRFDASALVRSGANASGSPHSSDKVFKVRGLRSRHRIISRDPVVGLLLGIGIRRRIDFRVGFARGFGSSPPRPEAAGIRPREAPRGYSKVRMAQLDQAFQKIRQLADDPEQERNVAR